MVHVSSVGLFCHDFWQREPSGPTVYVDCLMPNGVIIPLEVPRDITLLEMKEDLWEESTKYPLHGTLQDESSYVFSCISSTAETVELLDETRRLCDIKPFTNVIRVIERKSKTEDRKLKSEIGMLIGKGLHEFDALKNPEVNDFRWKMKLLVDDIAKDKERRSWFERVDCQFPPRRSTSPELPPYLISKLVNGELVVATKFENTETTFRNVVPYTETIHQLLSRVLRKKAVTYNTPEEHPSDFVLKVCGREEYLRGDYPLSQFLCIRDMISQNQEVITLVICNVESIPLESENVYENPPDYTVGDMKNRSSSSTLTLRGRGKGKVTSALAIEEYYSFRVNAVGKLNCEPQTEIGAMASLFHGGKALCEPQQTKHVQWSGDGMCSWDEDLQFDLEVCNIPRMARLCLVVFEICKNGKTVKARRLKSDNQDIYVNPLAWVNTTVYDFRNQLKTGAITLYMWTYADDVQNDDLFHSLGTVVSHPDVECATALTITFHRYHTENTVVYPSVEKLVEFAANYSEVNVSQSLGMSRYGKTYMEVLHQISERDPLHEMHEQEKKLIWTQRNECMMYLPDLLPKVLDCVEWNDHKEIAIVTSLLQNWPKLPICKALELLDYAYPDHAVRSFAVECLMDISDEELSMYLLQLVQALKHESYLSCDLVEFLLRRALNNQAIGHYLFWHLRSEMHVPSVSVRFGLLLEAYCRGNLEHMRILMQQLEALGKLKTLSEAVHDRRDREKARAFVQETLTANHCSDTFSNMLSPLNPSYRFSKVKTEKCRVMDSKMKPLWLVFDNDDPHGNDIYVIFKNGDDLRQDMLTLQMIRIMDKLWKDEGYDFRMIPYGCISTDYRVGLIEVVLNAETIANIQKEKGLFTATCAFRKGSLLEWLKDHNPTESQLNQAISDFTLSCAGYCVATYILGIADRHSDNIMIKKSGQLFHIDFGHILGHFKEKFGIRRERVPFVLTHDFVYVITNGQTKKHNDEFQNFRTYCEQAFLILRRHGSFILSLFAMMISTGLPELSSEKDVNYLRDTLVLDLSEQEALRHFRSKFDEALSNSWKTSWNWASHNVAKNNKQ